MEFSDNNVLILTAADKGKKGGGVNAILSLLQELIAFQDKVSSAVDAQDLGENKRKLEEFQTRLDEMYGSLLEMAKGGVRSLRQEPKQENKPQFTMNDNSIQKLP